ncbi:MAG TPA: BPSS1780 family membrane protein [Burkholderiaceae bacterium]
MRIKVLAARNGLIWIRDGWRLFGRHPLSLAGSVAAGLLMLWLPSTIPWVGPAIGAIVAPIVSLGLIASCRAADAGRIPSVTVYADGLRDSQTRRQLLVLGAINASIVLLLVAIVQATGMDDAIKVVSGPDRQPRFETNPALLAARIAMSAPLLMAMWLAPPLVGWRHLPALKAMFYSFFACWRNRWPLLAFIGGVVAAGSVATMALGVVVGLVVTDRTVGALLIAPIALALLAVFQGGIFQMYTQVVEPSAEDPSAV